MAMTIPRWNEQQVRRIEEMALEVITGTKKLENSKAIRYHRVAPLNGDFIRVYRIKLVTVGNVTLLGFHLSPPDSARYVSISLAENGVDMVILFGRTVNHQPQKYAAAIGYQIHEMSIAHRDVHKYLAKGFIPTPTENN